MTEQLLDNIKQTLPDIKLQNAIKHNKAKFMAQHLKKPFPASIRYSMYKTSYGPTNYKTYGQESSDSESIVYDTHEFPCVHRVIAHIKLPELYTLSEYHPEQQLLLQLTDCDLLTIKESLSNYDIQQVIYNNNSCLLINEPQFDIKILDNLMLEEYSLHSIIKKDNSQFYAIIIRGLDAMWTVSQIEKIISYNLSLPKEQAIVRSEKWQIDGVICMITIMLDLEYCEQIIIALNGTNLSGLQKQNVLVNVHPESSKKRLNVATTAQGIIKKVKI